MIELNSNTVRVFEQNRVITRREVLSVFRAMNERGIEFALYELIDIFDVFV